MENALLCLKGLEKDAVRMDEALELPKIGWRRHQKVFKDSRPNKVVKALCGFKTVRRLSDVQTDEKRNIKNVCRSPPPNNNNNV